MLKGGTGMDERTMFELLEIYDAKVELQKDKELMEGIDAVYTLGTIIKFRARSIVMSPFRSYKSYTTSGHIS